MTRTETFARIGERMAAMPARPVSYDMPRLNDLIRRIEDRLAARERAVQ